MTRTPMTSRWNRVKRHGLTLVEFMLAISITAFVAAASAAMMTAAVQGTEFDREMREMVVRGQASNVRLASYVAPSRWILNTRPNSVVLWLDDERLGGTVHATEVRWIDYDPIRQAVQVHLVRFPTDWSQMERDLMDLELPYPSTDWWMILAQYRMMGYTSTITLCDAVSMFTVTHDSSTPKGERLVTFSVTFNASAGGRTLISASSIRDFSEPIR